jgi:hypothetical protein
MEFVDVMMMKKKTKYKLGIIHGCYTQDPSLAKKVIWNFFRLCPWICFVRRDRNLLG